MMRPATFSGRQASQLSQELEQFVNLLIGYGVRSYLEVGAREGDTFHYVMSVLGAGCRGVAVDLPGGAWGKLSTGPKLRRACDDLRAHRIDVVEVLGDSHAVEVQRTVCGYGPFDAVLIDGDHRYDPVMRDWQSYGSLAPIVAFHDIAGDGQQTRDGMPVEVPIAWREIKRHHEHDELVATGSPMGIGVVYPKGRPSR